MKFTLESHEAPAPVDIPVDHEFVAKLVSLDDAVVDGLDVLDQDDGEPAVVTEGMLDGVLGDWDTIPIVSSIVAFARNNLPSVKEQIDICKKKLAETKDEDIVVRSRQTLIRVRSKYLPSVAVFNKSVKVLTDAFNAVAANPKGEFRVFASKLKGSMYEPKNGFPTGQQNTDWEYITWRTLPTLVGSLVQFTTGVPAMAAPVVGKIVEREYYAKSQPVGKRGWNKREVFVNGLKSMESLIAALAKAVGAVGRVKGGTEAADAAYFCKWAEKEVVYLGRGLTTAIRKLYEGNVRRFISNRIVH